MTEALPRRCRCGNLARDGRPSCGIVICLANNEIELAIRAAGRRAALASDNRP